MTIMGPLPQRLLTQTLKYKVTLLPEVETVDTAAANMPLDDAAIMSDFS